MYFQMVRLEEQTRLRLLSTFLHDAAQGAPMRQYKIITLYEKIYKRVFASDVTIEGPDDVKRLRYVSKASLGLKSLVNGGGLLYAAGNRLALDYSQVHSLAE